MNFKDPDDRTEFFRILTNPIEFQGDTLLSFQGGRASLASARAAASLIRTLTSSTHTRIRSPSSLRAAAAAAPCSLSGPSLATPPVSASFSASFSAFSASSSSSSPPQSSTDRDDDEAAPAASLAPPITIQ